MHRERLDAGREVGDGDGTTQILLSSADNAAVSNMEVNGIKIVTLHLNLCGL